jgi:hypothetical protein
MLKKEKTKILIAAGTCIILLSVFFLTSHIAPKEISPRENKITNSISPIVYAYSAENRTNATLEINNSKYEAEIKGATSVYDFMQELQKEGKINFEDKTYSGMGKLIEEIDGIKNSRDKNWIYYVNGKEAEIGVSNYNIKPGDIISWKYE